MENNIKKNLKLLIPKYELNDRTTKRIAMFAIVIPFIFGGLAIWFTYNKVSYSEKRYGDMFRKLTDSKQKLAEFKDQLDSSQKSITDSDLKLRLMQIQYTDASSHLRDSLWMEKKNMLSLRSASDNAQKHYQVILDSNMIQIERLSKNNEKIARSSQILASLNDSMNILKKSYRQSMDSLEIARADVAMMKSALESAQGLAAKIKPQARSRSIFGSKDSHDRPLYEFAVWLDIPKDIRKDIISVTYKYNMPMDVSGISGSNLQSVTVANSNDYKTTFPSWSCIRNMIIQVRFKAGVTTPLYFDLCKYLDNPQMPNPDK